MGVRGLWQVLEPTARPVLLESLRGKILAIDASIWIYHFLKAMRDPKGTILRAAHIIGFYRRICKLLFFEIKPVFVFDGAAPALKKLTTRRRGERRQGRELNARAAANKLLTLQIQRLRKEQELLQSRERQANDPEQSSHVDVVNDVPEGAVYMNELAESTKARDDTFVKEDQYHLPQIDKIVPIRINDRRLLTEDELDEYAKEFTNQARAGFIDTSSVDFASAEFERLPLTTQYQLLNTARLKSRLRMGYTSEELDQMFPSKMDFSKFQIDRVSQRNYFTQRLIKLVGMEDDLTRRVSGEKNREYMLKRNDQGWTLSLEDQSADTRSPEVKEEEEEGPGSADEFEDVDITAEGDMAARPTADIPSKEPLSENPGNASNMSSPAARENDASIDALFGYEDNLARKNFYESLGSEEEHSRDDINVNPGQSLLFSRLPGSNLSATHSADESEILPLHERTNNHESSFHDNTPSEHPPWFAEEGLNKEMKAAEKDDGSGLVAREKFDQNPTVHENFYETLGNYEETSPKEFTTEPGESLLFPRSAASTMQDEGATKSERADKHMDSGISSSSNGTKSQGSLKAADLSLIQTRESTEKENGQDSPELKMTRHHVLSTDEYAESPKTPPTPSLFNIAHVPPGSLHAGNNTKPESHSRNVITASGYEGQSQSEPYAVEGNRKALHKRPGGPLGNPSKVHASEATNLSKDYYAGNTQETPVSAGTESSDDLKMTKEDEFLAEDDARAAEDEDQDIAELLIGEAEENERFAKELKPGASRFDYNREIQQLRGQFSEAARDADNISGDMIQECQELLQIFGIPYITATTEAEAQCAELLELGLVHGIVTDDGDAFLFGDVVVYRNMFSQAKYVESYESDVIERELGLDRGQLIELALLLGSDYTDGLPGIGPVTGVEILAEFGDLRTFRDWWIDVQRKSPDALEDLSPLKRRLIRQFSSKLFLPENFPDQAVFDAYLHPAVDKDPTKFSWGMPDLDALRLFLNQTAGWDEQKVNETIVPVVQETKRRELQRRSAGAQTSLDDFYQRTRELKLGERTKKATRKLRERQHT